MAVNVRQQTHAQKHPPRQNSKRSSKEITRLPRPITKALLSLRQVLHHNQAITLPLPDRSNCILTGDYYKIC